MQAGALGRVVEHQAEHPGPTTAVEQGAQKSQDYGETFSAPVRGSEDMRAAMHVAQSDASVDVSARHASNRIFYLSFP
jgi:hypothetical protein